MLNPRSINLYISYGKLAIIFILVFVLGFVAINQAFHFFYTANLLNHPCDICKQANKPQASCIDYCFTNNNNIVYQEKEIKNNGLILPLNFTYP